MTMRRILHWLLYRILNAVLYLLLYWRPDPYLSALMAALAVGSAFIYL